MKIKVLTFLSITLFFLCFSLVFVVSFINSTDLECSLEPDSSYTCRISKQFFGMYPLSERVIENITDVTVEDDGCIDGCAYRVEFIQSNGNQEPFNNVYTDQRPVKRQAEFFSSQMNAREEVFTYHVNPPWWVLFLVGGLALLFIALAFFNMIRGVRTAEAPIDPM